MIGESRTAGFLAAAGYTGASARSLASDASLRRYWRIVGGPRPAVLMQAPPDRMPLRPFLAMREHLAGTGVSVPDVLAADLDAGLLLLEDFGDGLLSAVLDDGNRDRLLDLAVDGMLAIQSAPPPSGLPAWDASAMVRATGASLYDWWWPAVFGAPTPAEARTAIDAALAAMLAPLAHTPAVLVHRDWFAGNLFWLPGRCGLRRLGVIDFQDAALGHAAYDLLALVQDPRRELPPASAERALARYLAARPRCDPAAFRAAFDACAAQRHLRVAAQWVRLDRRDGKPHYLAHGPRTWRLLEAALRRPAAAPLAAVLERWIPPACRASPPSASAAA